MTSIQKYFPRSTKKKYIQQNKIKYKHISQQKDKQHTSAFKFILYLFRKETATNSNHNNNFSKQTIKFNLKKKKLAKNYFFCLTKHISFYEVSQKTYIYFKTNGQTDG